MKLNTARSSVTYGARYTFKKVQGKSQQLTGKFEDKGDFIQFELSVPIRSFLSGDKDLDQHLLEVTHPETFPLASARGQVPKEVFSQAKATIAAEVEFFGVARSYTIQLEKQGTRASLILALDAHGLERPSLLGIKIKNEVLVNFELFWE